MKLGEWWMGLVKLSELGITWGMWFSVLVEELALHVWLELRHGARALVNLG